MRASRVVTISIVMVAILLYWFNSVHAGPSLWPNSKGEICLQNVTNGEFVRLAVFRTIGNHYIVHGIVTEGSGNPSLFNGNAVIDGDKISMHVSSSGYAGNINTTVDEVYGFVGRVELDKSTLSGRVVGVGFHCEPLALCEFSYDGVQQLESATCP